MSVSYTVLRHDLQDPVMEALFSGVRHQIRRARATMREGGVFPQLEQPTVDYAISWLSHFNSRVDAIQRAQTILLEIEARLKA